MDWCYLPRWMWLLSECFTDVAFCYVGRFRMRLVWNLVTLLVSTRVPVCCMSTIHGKSYRSASNLFKIYLSIGTAQSAHQHVHEVRVVCRYKVVKTAVLDHKYLICPLSVLLKHVLSQRWITYWHWFNSVDHPKATHIGMHSMIFNGG